MIFSKNRSIFFSLVFSALMLSLSLISATISNIIPFVLGASFLRLDIGIAFIAMSFFIAGWRYGLITLISNFLIHPLLPGTNIGLIDLFFVGKTIFVITCLFFVGFIAIGNKLFKKKNYALSLSFSIFFTTIIMTVLNGIIFTPIFLNIISNGSFSLNFIELMKQYESSSLSVIFIIPNYWGGIALVYGLFNIASLGLNSAILYGLNKIMGEI
ncbi:MAG: MPN527 family putative ECF transporter permease subunit [Metamycoplasmataceae bacterium]